MKKLIYAVMLLLGMSVFMTSCEKEGGDGVSYEKLFGTWLCDARNGKTGYIELLDSGPVWEFTNTGKVNTYYWGGEWEEGYDGGPINYNSSTWNDMNNWYYDISLPYTYTKETNLLTIGGFFGFNITKFSKKEMTLTYFDLWGEEGADDLVLHFIRLK